MLILVGLVFILTMKPKTAGSIKRGHSKHIQAEGPNWILLAGGALLSTLSIRIGCKLKQALFDRKHMDNTHDFYKGLNIKYLLKISLL